MTRKTISDLLLRHGAGRADGDVVHLADGAELTLIADLGSEPMLIGGVLHIEFEDELLVATSRRERFALAYEDVRALRFGAPSASKPGY